MRPLGLKNLVPDHPSLKQQWQKVTGSLEVLLDATQRTKSSH